VARVGRNRLDKIRSSFNVSWPFAETYRIVCLKATAKITRIGRCRDRLLAEAADHTRRLQAAVSLP
jgi:hypothetical protein